MKIKALFTALALTAAGIASSNAVVSTSDIIARMFQMTTQIEESNNQVLFTQVDYIRHDEWRTQTLTLDEGVTYAIIVFGDNERVADIDCQVLDENENVIGTDADDTNTAVVTVTPKWTGQFTIVVDAYEMTGDSEDAFYGIIVARRLILEKSETVIYRSGESVFPGRFCVPTRLYPFHPPTNPYQTGSTILPSRSCFFVIVVARRSRPRCRGWF